MTIKDVLKEIRKTAFTEREKGFQFERLMQSWLKTDPRYASLFTDVWLWNDFPSKNDLGGNDTGIDLVAKTDSGEYWAIQCKCYAENAKIDKAEVDSFISTSSREFRNTADSHTVIFSQRLWIATTNKWGANAEDSIHNQNPPVSRINVGDLESSNVDWEKLLNGLTGKNALGKMKQLLPHQSTAISEAEKYFKDHDRGKLIMACGTGKTFTALRMVEHLAPQRALILFMVPSIALLGQALNDWSGDALNPIKAVCVCSDSKVSSKSKRISVSDEAEGSTVDLALPASTNIETITRQLLRYRNHNGLVVVFSTYQSINTVSEAQKEVLRMTDGDYGTFDFIVCDEAHRTTGVKLKGTDDESSFIKIHDNEIIHGAKRLYMTATPRIYGDNAKIKAARDECVLCSMDDEKLYGEEFFRVNFSYAVQNGILTDYKVLVLTVPESFIPENIMKEVRDKTRKELIYDDTARLIGIINGLSKKILGDMGLTWDSDPKLMRRALAFTHKIGSEKEPGSSKNIAKTLPQISELYNARLSKEGQRQTVHIKTRHVDGSMSAIERNDALTWLAEESEDPQECRIITNVRCLSEGVDVPALDAVLFLSAKNSQVDVVQSVGRVMRSFHKGQPDEKKYGYIIIPVVVPEGTNPEDALSDNASFSGVWNILNALRSHDDHFNAHVNAIALNHNKGSKVTVGLPGLGLGQMQQGDPNDLHDAALLSNEEIARQLALQFETVQKGIFAKLVEKCGDRMYWENWAGEVGLVARRYIERINKLVAENTGKLHEEFNQFVETLQSNLNPGIDAKQCIEMLAQHLITQPIFDTLFKDYRFVDNNSVSRSMQNMVELLRNESVDKGQDEMLGKFYESVRTNISDIDNLEGKQTIIKNLYEKFFKRAFPKTVEKLGTVYTPIECVDFIVRSVDSVLKSEFGASLSDEDVHILDPFTGTGTFITRLLQTGVIRHGDMLRKYRSEIHANEIMLLAYYIADVNIESVFQELCPQPKYEPFNGICLTDTFQLGESTDGHAFGNYFKENSKEVEEQKHTPIRVIIGNPPYSVGQRSANDNAQNQRYPNLEKRIAETYAANTSSTNKNSLYDSYIKAFRWASDRIDGNAGGVIGFISNGSWIDSNALNGFRLYLEKEFDIVYVFNLRGNQRTSGELSRREGGKIFGQGSRTPIAITILVKLPLQRRNGKCRIFYHDIGDYLSRDQKLKAIVDFQSIEGIQWTEITPNAKNDWINQRDGLFDTLIPITPGKKFDSNAQSVFVINSRGNETGRDSWVYSFSKLQLKNNIKSFLSEYSNNLGATRREELTSDETKISWTSSLVDKVLRGESIQMTNDFRESIYRPFTKEFTYRGESLVHRRGQFDSFFPTQNIRNLIICISSTGDNNFSVLISDCIPDLHATGTTQCFPRYWYREETSANKWNIFQEENPDRFKQIDGVSDWILREVRSRYSGAKSITKDDIFYYVYGLLHSPAYRRRFADDLRKSLPRIPIVEKAQDFMAFSKAGRELAKLHLDYETQPAPKGVTVEGRIPTSGNDIEYDYYRIEQMRFAEKGKRDSIILNSRITVSGITHRAYDYIVNGKSAIEWVMERYAVKTDTKSGITNDPNQWAREHDNPTYILDLLLSVITVSVETMKIVDSLPDISKELSGAVQCDRK